MESDLKGRVAMVTGSSRGIGRAIALRLAREGADVAVNYLRQESEAMDVCAQIRGMGQRSVAVQGNVAQAADVARLLTKVRQELGEVTILVNNAGIGKARSIDEVTETDWDETHAVNLKGCFLVSQAVLPDMRKARWGRIISVSSVAAQMGGVVGAHYASSKAGIVGLMHYYATYLAKEGITANAIAPGAIATDMADSLPLLRPDLIPVGRMGTVDEVAEVAVMLTRNGYITGQTINVNGGRYPA